MHESIVFTQLNLVTYIQIHVPPKMTTTLQFQEHFEKISRLSVCAYHVLYRGGDVERVVSDKW